jgi:hypothetical protein
MSRRKGEIAGHMNELEFPHLVELELPPGGFRSQNLEFDAFHRERGIPIRRGRGRHEVEQFHVCFCFPDAATADAFHERFVAFRTRRDIERYFSGDKLVDQLKRCEFVRASLFSLKRRSCSHQLRIPLSCPAYRALRWRASGLEKRLAAGSSLPNAAACPA